MEQKIQELFDELDLADTEKLLPTSRDVYEQPEDAANRRIRAMVLQKTGLKQKKRFFTLRKLVAAAAVVALLFTSFSLIGFDRVAAALNSLFSFIPGYGIIENNDAITYVLKMPANSENRTARLSLTNAIAGKDSITVMFETTRLDISQEQLKVEKQQEWDSILEEDTLENDLGFYLVAGEQIYRECSGSTGGGGITEYSTFNFFGIAPEDITTATQYRLVSTVYGLEIPFTLQQYDTFESLHQIGATDIHNDISITAVPEFGADQLLKVDLYAINKSNYAIDAFFSGGSYPYQGQDLYLQTNQGPRAYQPIASYGAGHSTFHFQLQEGDEELLLKIPYLIVQSTESAQVKLPIPELGQVQAVTEKVEFADSILNIREVEHIPAQAPGETAQLRIELSYENKTSHMVMCRSNFMRLNLWGTRQGGGYAIECDEDGIYQTLYFGLEESDRNSLRLEIFNPIYYLLGEYELQLERK